MSVSVALLKLPSCGAGNSSVATFLDSAKTTTFASGAFQVANFSQMTIQLGVSAVTGTSPTLDVAVQKLLPDGTTWQAIAQFTQVTGTATRVMHLVSGGNLEEAGATSLTAGTIHSVAFGGWWRLNFVIGGSTPVMTIATSLEGLR